MPFALYVMVSIPEAKMENVYTQPIMLGVFDSKESAQKAWKQRPAEFKDIKSKTVHTYCETMSTEQDALPEKVYLWANYQAYAFSEDEKPELEFTPYASGFFETYEAYAAKKAWLQAQKPIPWRTVCEESGFVFYASNADIVGEFELGRLVKAPVELTNVKEPF